MQLAELAAARGDAATAEAMLATLQDVRVSEEPQHQVNLIILAAFIAVAHREPEEVLRHARKAFVHLDAVGFRCLNWIWELAVRAAFELTDYAAVRQLVAMLGSMPPGQVHPMLRPEQDLARARLAAADGDQAAESVFASAVSGLRELSTPFHLAHGLLDQAAYLTGLGDNIAAAQAIDEAKSIGRRLRCQPLLDRAAALAPTEGISA
jgi:hypothetical protein